MSSKTKATVEEIQALGSSLDGDVASAWPALEALAKVQWEAATASAFKAAGHINHVLRWMEPPGPIVMRTASANLINKLIKVDASCCSEVKQAGLTAKVCAALDDPDASLVKAIISAMVTYLAHLEEHVKKDALEEMFRLNGIGKAVNLLNPDRQPYDVADRAASLLTIATTRVAFHERIRDTGIVQRCVDLAAVTPEPRRFLVNLQNLARNDSLHLCIRATGAKEKLMVVLEKQQEEEVRARILIIFAHVYSSAEDTDVDALLTKFDVSGFVLGALKAAVTGDGWLRGTKHTVQEEAQDIQAVARNRQDALRLATEGCAQLLVQALSAPQDNETSVAICRSLLALANHLDTHQLLRTCGTVDVLTKYVGSPDLRVADAARGTMLLLGALQDQAAEAAAAVAAAPLHTVCYDVFLSHKRTDSKDFARALYNLLVLRGFSTFLDCEYREELENLEAIVATCANFIFILTDNVFESKWCIKELTAAATAGVNIILLVKEGSRWKDSSGSPVCEFPPYPLIESLPEVTRRVFSRKALSHSDEYYQAFVEMLLQKLKTREQSQQGAPVPPAAATVPNLQGNGNPTSAPQNLVGLSHNLAAQPTSLAEHAQMATALPTVNQAPLLPRNSFLSLPPNLPARNSLLNAGEGSQGVSSSEFAELARSISESVSARQRTLMTAQMAGLKGELAAEVAGLKGELVTEVAGLCGDLGSSMHYMGDSIRQDLRSMVEAIHTLAASVSQLNATVAAMDARGASNPPEGHQDNRLRGPRGHSISGLHNHSLPYHSNGPTNYHPHGFPNAYQQTSAHHLTAMNSTSSSSSAMHMHSKSQPAFQKESGKALPSTSSLGEQHQVVRSGHGQPSSSTVPSNLRQVSSENGAAASMDNGHQAQPNIAITAPPIQPNNAAARKANQRAQPSKKKTGAPYAPRELPAVPTRHSS